MKLTNFYQNNKLKVKYIKLKNNLQLKTINIYSK